MNMRRIIAGIWLALALPCLAVGQTSGHFDLKGEKLGESLEAFKKIHPLANCRTNKPEEQTEFGEDACTVFRGVSFAGLPARSDADCDKMDSKVGDGRNCWEALNASFRGGRMITLTYSVSAEGGQELALYQVMSALTEKFGKPNIKGGRLWTNSAEALFVDGHDWPLGQGKGTVSVIYISLAKIEDYSKDI